MRIRPATQSFSRRFFRGLWVPLCVVVFGCGVHTKPLTRSESAPRRDAALTKSEDLTGRSSEEAARIIGQWRQSCRRGRGVHCFNLAQLFHLGIQLEPDAEEALMLYRRGCDNKYKKSCLYAGKIALDDSRSYYSPQQAIAAFARGCQLKSARSCYQAGSFWLEGIGIREDFFKASAYFGLACRGEFGPACTHLGVMAQHGIGLQPSQKAAILLFEKGCQHLDAASCYLASRLLRGSRDEETRFKALNYSEQACLGDDARGCVVRGDLARELSLEEEAGTYYRRACDLNDALGCYRLALLSDKNPELLLRACDANVLDACIAAGVGALNENPPRFSVAGRLFAKACDEERAIGCYQLAKLWETHPHFIPGPGALRGAKKRACEGGVLQACGASN